MDKNRAWELLNDISFVRVAGTREELKAANILKKAAEAAGAEAVIEDFEIEEATISEAVFEVLEPEYCSYPVIGIGKTKNTRKEGITGGFKYLDYFASVGRDVQGPVYIGSREDLDATLEETSRFGVAKDIDFQAIFDACPFKEHVKKWQE